MAITQVRNKIDDFLGVRWPALVTAQDNYFAMRGRYFQGMWTHANLVEQTDALNGDIIPDNLAQIAPNDFHHWQDFIGNALNSIPFPARLRISIYDGCANPTGGIGWIATIQVLYKGIVYSRSKGYGPQDRDQSWHQEDVL